MYSNDGFTVLEIDFVLGEQGEKNKGYIIQSFYSALKKIKEGKSKAIFEELKAQ